MNATRIRQHHRREHTAGDRYALALLFAFFAISAFAMNPPGWGLFDWLAVTAFALLALWNLWKLFRPTKPARDLAQ
jgi:hypothetical protein